MTIKTEAIEIGSRATLSITQAQSIEVDGNCIPFCSCLKNLGVYLDSTLSMHERIRLLCRSSFLALKIRRIASVRSYLTESTSTQLVSSFITSGLDYCTALLTGLPLMESRRLQRIQNNASRLFMGKSKRTHITPVLQHLHWLPISGRVEYNIATLPTVTVMEHFHPTYHLP